MTSSNLPIAVVGSGAGGLPAAVALAEAGYEIVLIERGQQVARQKSPTNRFDYEITQPPWPTASDEWQGPLRVQRALGLGGSTLHFQAVSHLPAPGTFSSWGLDERTLDQVHREVVDFLKIAGEVQPSHRLNPVSNHLLNAAHGLGWQARSAPVAILSQPHQGRPACNSCGLCIHGCLPGDRSSVDNTWWPRLKKTGRVQLLTEHQVKFIELSSSDSVKALRVVGPSGLSTLPVQAVVLAAGALETPYLLKKSRQKNASEGLGNTHVGRNLTGTLWHSLIVAVNQRAGHVGVPVDILIEQFVSEGILMAQGRNLGAITGPISAAKAYGKPLAMTNLRSWMRDYYPRLATLGGYAESSTTFSDGLVVGDQKRIDKKIDLSDRIKINQIQKRLELWARQAKAEKIHEMGSLQSHLAGSMLRGTCRLSLDKNQGAVDPQGRLRGIKNLVVSDSSVLGRGLIANPSLSLQMLGLYFGRLLAQRLKHS